MTSYEFEVAAKNAAISVLHNQYKLDVPMERMHTVWFAHVLGDKKCLLWPQIPGNTYYIEVAYNSVWPQLYVDVYEKNYYTIVPETDFNFTA